MSTKESNPMSSYDRLEESKPSTPVADYNKILSPDVLNNSGVRKRSDERASFRLKMQQNIPEVMKHSNLSKKSSSSHSSSLFLTQENLRTIDSSKDIFLSNVPEVSRVSVYSRMSFFNLNELPYVSQMRSLLLILCATSFITSPLAFMPLGTIQAAYDQKCFLYTKVCLRRLTSAENKTNLIEIAFDSVATEWGPVSICDFTTFVPVSVSIYSIIVGASTFTIWPMMMSLGRGGALMMTYTFMSLLSLIACTVSVVFLDDGYANTCRMMKEETHEIRKGGLTCQKLNNQEIYVQEVEKSFIANNIHRAMTVAEVISWILVGLSFSKVFICILTFVIIWFYLNK